MGGRRDDTTGTTGTGDPGISCQELVGLVTDYLEGVLDAATHRRVEAHLAICDGCTEYLEQMRTTIRLLGHVPVATLSEQAQDDLMAAFRSYHATTPPERG